MSTILFLTMWAVFLEMASPVIIIGGAVTGWLWRSRRRWAVLCGLAVPVTAFVLYAFAAHMDYVERGITRTSPNAWLFISQLIATALWTTIFASLLAVAARLGLRQAYGASKE